MTDQKQDKAQQPEKQKKVKKEKTETKVSGKLQKIIDQIAELSVLELSDLVKAIEDKFDVQAMAAAPIAAAPAAGNGNGSTEEKTEFNVVMTETGGNKINVIKALREIKLDLGLKDAKDMTEQLPAEILTGVKKEPAEEAKKKLEEAGAKVELK